MVSKSHASLFFPTDNKTPYIVDLESNNCTFVNDIKLTSYKMYQLSDGDELSFGPRTRLIYLSAKAFYEFLSALKHLYPEPESCVN